MRQWTLYSSHKAAYFKSNTFWFFSWKSYHILLIWDVRSEVQWDSRASALTIVQSRHWLWLGQASLSPSLTQILITFQLWGVMSLWAHFFPVSWGNAHFSGHHSPDECTLWLVQGTQRGNQQALILRCASVRLSSYPEVPSFHAWRHSFFLRNVCIRLFLLAH